VGVVVVMAKMTCLDGDQRETRENFSDFSWKKSSHYDVCKRRRPVNSKKTYDVLYMPNSLWKNVKEDEQKSKFKRSD
jgi:hypothetical protein